MSESESSQSRSWSVCWSKTNRWWLLVSTDCEPPGRDTWTSLTDDVGPSHWLLQSQSILSPIACHTAAAAAAACHTIVHHYVPGRGWSALEVMITWLQFYTLMNNLSAVLSWRTVSSCQDVTAAAARWLCHVSTASGIVISKQHAHRQIVGETMQVGIFVKLHRALWKSVMLYLGSEDSSVQRQVLSYIDNIFLTFTNFYVKNIF